jgi:DNA-binding MarR family transcriptional regulator
MTKEDYIRLMKIWARIVSKMNAADCKKRYYGTNYLLSPAEIHLLQAIGYSPGTRVSDMAKHQGVTKGAISQMVNKLAARDLIVKYSAPGNDKEVLLRLTRSGQTARKRHDSVHAMFVEKMTGEMGDLTEEQARFLEKFLNAVELCADDYNAMEE